MKEYRSTVLDGVLIGILLADRDILRETDLQDVPVDVRPVVQSMQSDELTKESLHPLALWLKENGVEWTAGKIVDAVLTRQAEVAERERRRASSRDVFTLAANLLSLSDDEFQVVRQRLAESKREASTLSIGATEAADLSVS